MNFFFGGPFWAKNRKSAKKVAFCQKSSDLSAKHGVGTGLPHRIQYFWRIGKILKIADFMDKSVDAKNVFLPLRSRAAFAQKSLDFRLKYLVGRVLAQTFRISWQIWKILKIADFMSKTLKLCLFHFLKKLVNPLSTKLSVVQKFLQNMICSSSIYLHFLFHKGCCQMK